MAALQPVGAEPEEIQALCAGAQTLHLHWSADPDMLKFLHRFFPARPLIMSYVVDDYAAYNHLPRNVFDFGDLMILGMAFPNILGVYFLVPRVKKELTE